MSNKNKKISFVIQRGKSSDFVFMKIRLLFGSDEDPENKSGMAHFLEHYLSFSLKGNVSDFIFDKSSAVTGNSYVDFEFVIPTKDSREELHKIINTVVNPEFKEEIFREQQLKVAFEAAHLPYSQGLKRVQQEEMRRGWKPPAGKADEILKIHPAELHNHYFSMLRKYGATVVMIVPCRSETLNQCEQILSHSDAGESAWGNDYRTNYKLKNEKEEENSAGGYLVRYEFSDLTPTERVELWSIKETLTHYKREVSVYQVEHGNETILYVFSNTEEEMKMIVKLLDLYGEEISAFREGKEYCWQSVCLEEEHWRLEALSFYGEKVPDNFGDREWYRKILSEESGKSLKMKGEWIVNK